MPHRFRTAASLAAIAVLALAACTPAEGEPASAGSPAPAAADSPAATTAAVTKPAGPTVNESCATITKALIDGSVGIADDSVKSIDERWNTKKVNDAMRKRFDAMATKVKAEAARVTDPELKTEMEKVAAQLADAAKSSTPDAFLNSDFQTISKGVDKRCGN